MKQKREMKDEQIYIPIKGNDHVADFELAKYLVTNREYRHFIESGNDKHRSRYDEHQRFNGDDQPVVGVSWHDAVAYCQWLTDSMADGHTYRLPTEAEWEWAASGGKRKYPWGNEEPDNTRANYDRKVGHTTPVGAYPAGATPEGLMDMAGNAWEWCQDSYDKENNARVLRGGAWLSQPRNVACAVRSSDEPDNRSFIIGFRCARTRSC